MTDIREEEGSKAEKDLQKNYFERIFFEICDVCSEEMIKSKQKCIIITHPLFRMYI